MTQALYAHMNNKTIKKKTREQSKTWRRKKNETLSSIKKAKKL
jgi:hypothetical protein